MPEPIERFPLFPLPLVLLPHEVLPLHIFEDRYRQMIEECLEQEGEFGVIWLSDDGLKEVGCSAAVTRLLERMEDGRMNVLVEGRRPFRLLRKIDDMPYPAGDVELLDDADEEVDSDLAAAARERYAELVARATDTRPPDAELAELHSYGMAATVDFALGAKQELLEERSEEARLGMVGELFGAAMKRLEYIERATERARQNGKVRF